MMSSMPPCVHCARDVDLDWRYCPFCGTNQDKRRILLELLGSTQPLKARELARFLSERIGCQTTKSEANRLLYRLMKCGLIAKDTSFRWSLVASVPAGTNENHSNDFPSRDDYANENASKDTSPLPSTEIGHWIFTLEPKGETEQRIWGFRCLLCGQEIRSVFNGTSAYWLWARLRTRRLDHDHKNHPDTLSDQLGAEKAHVDTRTGGKLLDYPSVKRSGSVESQLSYRPVAVDEQMKASLGRRLMRGFSLLKGNK